MASIAQLFLDETGDFSPNGDDMRMVGGLLVVTQASVGKDLEQIHASVTNALAWPVRLHARELVEPGCILRWHASGGAAQRALLDPAEVVALDAALAAFPQAAPHQRGPIWSTVSRVPKTSPHRAVLVQVGEKLLRRAQAFLRAAFQQWCGGQKQAFIIAGHVDERVPGGAQAYDVGIDQALRVAARTAAKAGASGIDVEIAEPGVQTVSEIERRALRVNGIARVAIVKYDVGTSGLWLADSLLAWTRPPPRAVAVSALHPSMGVRRCLRVASSSRVDRPKLLEYPFDFFADAAVDTEGLL